LLVGGAGVLQPERHSRVAVGAERGDETRSSPGLLP
jgi:hypothetical protein